MPPSQKIHANIAPRDQSRELALSSDKRGTLSGIADANFNSLIAQHTLCCNEGKCEEIWFSTADVYTNQTLEATMFPATTRYRERKSLPLVRIDGDVDRAKAFSSGSAGRRLPTHASSTTTPEKTTVANGCNTTRSSSAIACQRRQSRT